MLALSCQRCAKPTDTAHSAGAVCHDCLAREAVAADLSEYGRLLHKPYAVNAEQLARVRNRVARKVLSVVHGQPGLELAAQMLTEAATPRSRIVRV